MNKLGELAALGTAVLWTFGAISFERASKRSGSMAVNFIRLIMAFLLVGGILLLQGKDFLPWQAPSSSLLWLGLSGVVGFALGDLFLFQSFIKLGARITMLIYALAPPMAAMGGWIFLGEGLSWIQFIGMLATVAGICIVILKKEQGQQIRMGYSIAGILSAVAGTLGQAMGTVLSKLGMRGLDAFSSNQIRLSAGIVSFVFILFFLRAWIRVTKGVKDKTTLLFSFFGALLGPALGVTLYLFALQVARVGVVSTLVALVPVFILIPDHFINKQPVRGKEIGGALVAVTGSALFFLF